MKIIPLVFVLISGATLVSSIDTTTPTVPFEISALDFDAALETDNGNFGDCADMAALGVDAQVTQYDGLCKEFSPCHIAFTQPEEYISYTFHTNSADAVATSNGDSVIYVDITVRVASFSSDKEFQLEVYDDGELNSVESFFAPGEGYQHFNDVIWRHVKLRDTQSHQLVVTFIGGNTNMCTVSVTLTDRLAPIAFPAPYYFEAKDNTEEHLGLCGDLINDPVDSLNRADQICYQRDGGVCNIGFTEAGEYVSYLFFVDSDDDFDIWARIASNGSGKTIRMELEPLGKPKLVSPVFEAPGNGWMDYEDAVWDLLYLEEGQYILTIFFETGGINMCSVAIRYSTMRYFTFVPSSGALIDPLFYADYSELTSERFGNCPEEAFVGATFGSSPVDAQPNSDPDCPGPCHIGFTESGEFTLYQFETPVVVRYVQIILRLASANPNKRVRVQLFRGGGLGELNVDVYPPGNGFQEFGDVIAYDYIFVGSSTLHSMYVHFEDGDVNLCGIQIKASL